MRPLRSRLNLSSLGACAVLFLFCRAFGQPVQSAPEQSIKAAYLYNFAGYVEWPDGILDGRNSRLTVGVLGDDALADELERIAADRRVHGRSLRIRRIGAADSLQDLQILFIDAAKAEILAALVPEARSKSILLVTESDDALASGSVINFRLMDQRVRFEVSLDAADESRLAISSRLLAVAERVQPRSGG